MNFNFKTNFKANIDQKLFDGLFDKVDAIVTNRYDPDATESYLANLKTIAHQSGNSDLEGKIKVTAGHFVDLTMERLRGTSPRVFGADGMELLDKALSFNDRYKLGKEGQLGQACLDIVLQLKDKTAARDAIAKLLYNHLDWILENKRNDVKAKLFDLYFSQNNSLPSSSSVTPAVPQSTSSSNLQTVLEVDSNQKKEAGSKMTKAEKARKQAQLNEEWQQYGGRPKR